MFGEQALRGVSESFAEAVNAAVIGRDESIFLGEAGGDAEACYSRGGCDAADD
jgi:hypothetical protein